MSSALEGDRPHFRPVPCPHCGAPLKVVPIVYGYPLPEKFDLARRGEVVLGGCLVSDDDPKYVCAACGEPVDLRALPRMA